MASLNPSLTPEPVPVPVPLPLPAPEPEPEPEPQLQLTSLPTATLAEPNPNPDTPSYEPPMGVPLLLPAPSSARRLPPPCWTPDETSCLIDAYRLKWHSLRRGNLRAAHWQEVADEIHSRCPDVSPPKTAVQCRHKMEKLRKRYRAELLRAKSIPHHRFSSSWVYFSKMDSLDKSSSSLPSPQPISHAPMPSAVDDDRALPAPDDNDDAVDDDVTLRSYRQPTTGLSSRNYQHPDAHRIRITGNTSHRSTTYGDFDDSPAPNPNYGFKANYAPKTGYPTNTFGTPQYYGGRLVNNNNNNSSSSASAGPSGMGTEMNYMDVNNKKRKMLNGVDKRERGKDKGDEAAMEMVDAIRMLGEGFVRMEKMKMEMMRETERLRMDMEMKRTQMLLDSQHRIVQAFAKGWSDVFNNPNTDHAAS